MRAVSGPICILAVLLTAGAVPAGAQQPSAEQQMDALFADEWSTRLRENPLLATSMGVGDYNHRLPGASFDDIERRRRQAAAFMDRLSRIDIDALPEGPQAGLRAFRVDASQPYRDRRVLP